MSLDAWGVELLCRAWWLGEHPAGPIWNKLDSATRSQVEVQAKRLLENSTPHTMGDIAAVAELPKLLAENNLRHQARISLLARLPTRELLSALRLSKASGYANWDGLEFHPHRPEKRTPQLLVSEAQLKAVLSVREHLPNKREARATRQQKARGASSERPGKPSGRKR